MNHKCLTLLVLTLFLCACLAFPQGKPGEGKDDAGKGEDKKPDAGKGEDKKPDAGKGEDKQPDAGKGEDKKPDAGKEEDKKPDAGKDEKPDAGKGKEDKPGKEGSKGEESGSGESEEPMTDKEEAEEEKAEENPDIFEGDLKLDKEDIEEATKGSLTRRDAVTGANKLWKEGRVPYILDRTFDSKRKTVLKEAIKEFNDKTCIKVVPKTGKDKDYIRFFVDRGCYATSIGKRRRGGELKISIGQGCNWKGTIVHEIMHAIGFYHEQSRLDRDRYISIIWQNIQRNRESQFWNYGHGEADYLGEPYDFDSVMHYHKTAFSIDGQRPTIIAKDKPQRRLGQRKGLSQVDINQVNKLYKCDGKKSNLGKAGAKGGQAPVGSQAAQGMGNQWRGSNGQLGANAGGGNKGGRGKGGRGPEQEKPHEMQIKVLKFIKK